MYLLARHVHACVAGRHVVLMDLERNKYVAVEPSRPLALWVCGWPVAAHADAAAHDEGARVLLRELLAHGMLVTDPEQGRPATPVVTARPERALLEREFDSDLAARRRVHAAHLTRFARAWARARLSLALRPIQSIIESVRELRRRPGRGPAPVLAASQTAVTAFVRLRPLFYTLRDACLLDSLTMIHYLGGYGLHPDWIFGVRTEPFATRCWLQHGEVVLNDVPERVRQYSPIVLV